MKKITAQSSAPVHGPHQPGNPETVWWVHGTAYSDDPAQLAYFESAGYPLEDAPDGPPAEHLAAVASLKAQAQHVVLGASALPDTLQPDARNYH